MNYRVVFVLAVISATAASAADLYVSPTGDNGNSGTQEEPLATLAGARDAVRRLKQAGSLQQPLTVRVGGGTYFLPQAVEFSQQDSGTAAAPITYLGERGASVRLTGGREVSGWRPVADAAVLERLPAEARGHVVVADLRAQGLTDFGQLGVRGFSAGSPNAEAEKEPWVFAYWHHDWAELFEPLAGVDPAKHALLRTAKVKPVYGLTPNRARWYAFNPLAELDRPGEYYVDRAAGLLYFWPPRAGGRAVLSVSDGLIRGENLAHVTFRGFILEACRGTAVALQGGEDCHLVGCTIRNTGLRGATVSGGQRHEVYGCDVYFTGAGGLSLSGGQRTTLTPAGHNAENNHVDHYARRARTYHTAITVSGVGNRIAHNLVHDGPHMALSAGGNDHVVEFNEIHNVVEESGDAGAYYVGRDWTQRGNILRYNYWHQILGSTGYGGMTIYLDDQHCGHTIHGNLFERCMQAVFIGGGDDNAVTNNVFLDCWKAAHLDNRGMGWQKAATDDPKATLRSGLRAVPYTNELWRGRYPTLVTILEDDPGVPKRNVFSRNISAGGKWEDIAPAIRQLQTVSANLVFDADKDWARLTKDADGRPLRLEFKDPAAVHAIGFEPLPLEKMGLYADERRATWPVQHDVRVAEAP